MATFKKGDNIFSPREDTTASPSPASPAEAAPFPSDSCGEDGVPVAPADTAAVDASSADLQVLKTASVTQTPLSEGADLPAAARRFGTDYRPRQRVKLLRPWGYVGYSLLFSLPLVGLIFAIVFACKGEHKNRANFARGWLLLLVISLLLLAAAGTCLYLFYLKPLLDGGFIAGFPFLR